MLPGASSQLREPHPSIPSHPTAWNARRDNLNHTKKRVKAVLLMKSIIATLVVGDDLPRIRIWIWIRSHPHLVGAQSGQLGEGLFDAHLLGGAGNMNGHNISDLAELKLVNQEVPESVDCEDTDEQERGS